MILLTFEAVVRVTSFLSRELGFEEAGLLWRRGLGVGGLSETTQEALLRHDDRMAASPGCFSA